MASSVPPALTGRPSYLLGRLYMRACALEADALAALGLGIKQHAVLSLLADEGSESQQAVGQRLGIDRTTTVTVVDGLVENGYLERQRHPSDRRAYLLVLTDAGIEAERRGSALIDTARDELFAVLTPDERRFLVEMLGRAADMGPDLRS